MQVELILKLLLNKDFQKLFGLTTLLALTFVAGRASTNDCVIEEVCFDIKKDRDILSEQLVNQRKSCLREKTKSLQDLKKELDDSCQKRIDEILKKIDFYPEVHCNICKAKGHCK